MGVSSCCDVTATMKPSEESKNKKTPKVLNNKKNKIKYYTFGKKKQNWNNRQNYKT